TTHAAEGTHAQLHKGCRWPRRLRPRCGPHTHQPVLPTTVRGDANFLEKNFGFARFFPYRPVFFIIEPDGVSASDPSAVGAWHALAWVGNGSPGRTGHEATIQPARATSCLLVAAFRGTAATVVTREPGLCPCR